MELKGLPVELIPAMKRKLLAEAKKEEFEARRAEFNARGVEIDLHKKDVEYQRMLAGDFFFKKFYFDTDVNSKSVGFCMDQLDQWDRMSTGSEEIEIIITSPGGSVTDGLALFDHIKYLQRKGHTINTTALGLAASMGGILLQAGNIRAMSRESWLLIHQVSAAAMGSYGEMEDRLKWLDMVQQRILSIFADRAAGSNAEKPITLKQLERNWERTDWWLSSDEALTLGLVDEIH